MQGQLWFTEILNRAFAKPVNAVLQALPPVFHPANPDAPIPNHVAMEVLIVVFLIVLFLLIRSRLSVAKPGGLQYLAEMMNEFISDQSEQVIGHGGERFTPFLTALFLFILFSNLLGLIPTFESPTGAIQITLGCAVVAFLYYNLHGIRVQGPIGYLKHFFGPVWWLAPLLFIIEIISHLARIMSLSVRLYANMFAGDAVTNAFFSLVPIGLPVIFLGLHLFVAFLQAYVFVLLTTIYLQGAVAQEH
ncbi:MAG TPA: F0F1 ATP synthase subunit A [Candidatus Angelobacter sp.]|nr:F0F1 ATP synthase subunit A [Candidatus Angelobacter sp.]